ncbi:MAG: hypothetical protein J6U64_03590, partial [Alphaproteobacteria bacterium]|nr:hypothetical protein [Alphaproteobacteria bacterium]
MKLIDQLFQQCYKEGISQEDFLQHLGAEAYRLQAIAIRDGQFPQSSQNNYQRIKDGELTIDMGFILEALYNAKRETVNTTSQEDLTQRHEDMLTAIQNDTLMELEDQKKGPVRGSEITHDSSERSFIHRLPKNRRQNGWSRGNHRFGRFSVNADMNPDLIKDLDKFCSTHKCYYKTCCPTDWDKRVDPVTVYVFEPITEDLKKEFTNLIGKYVRNSRSDLNELLDGNTLIPGVTYDRDWSYDEGMKFINSLPPFLREGALDFTSSQRKTRTAMSLGYRTTIEDFYRLYQQYEPKFQKVSTAENTSF